MADAARVAIHDVAAGAVRPTAATATLVDRVGRPVAALLFAAGTSRVPGATITHIQVVDMRWYRAREDALHAAANVDDLTGLLNRRGFAVAAPQLMDVAVGNAPLSRSSSSTSTD